MSYNTVAEADAYFSAGYGYDKWPGLDNAAKQQALDSAQRQLDVSCTWYGDKCDSSQDNAFPRTPDCPNVPADVKAAECEIAYNIVSTGSTSTGSGAQLTEIKAGSVGLKFEAGAAGNPLVNTLTTKLLLPYGMCSGSGTTTVIPIVRT